MGQHLRSHYQGGQMNEYKILVIDDEVTLAEFIKKILIELNDDEKNLLVETANTGNDGIEIAKNFSPDVVLLDIKLPDISGIKILSLLKQFDPDVQVIIMTGFASLDTAVTAVREGAYDYINKPFDSSDQLKTLVRNALERRHLVLEKKQLMNELTEVNQALEDANKILQQTRDELIKSEKMASVGQLAAGLAHEVGNPLAAVIGYLELLRQQIITENEQDIIERTLIETKRIDYLVRELLEYARPALSSNVEELNLLDEILYN